MNIVKNEMGIIMLEQYGNKYIQYDVGGICPIILQIRITNEQFERVLKNEITMTSVINYYENRNLCSPDTARNTLIKDYLNSVGTYSQERIIAIIEKLNRYSDIFYEFYYYVLSEQFTEDPIEVEGYTAQQLKKNYPLSVLGAYNYLIYLREEPKQALSSLKTGLQSKDSFKLEKIKEVELEEEKISNSSES